MKLRVDDCTHLDSWLHQWDARFKLVSLLGLMAAFATVDSLWLLPWMGLVVAVLYKCSQLPLSFLTQRLRYPGLFLLGVLFCIPWVSGHTALWQWGPFTLWQEGCLVALLIAGRFICSVTVGFIILGTTPFVTLVKAVRSLGLPPLLTDMMLLAYRYLFEILAHSNRMRRAMTLRGFGYQAQTQKSSTKANTPGRSQQVQTLAAVTG
ncbi:MAG: cobalt ECF transporter T component CbiQ, partial [Cyanothece sp. SIO2G6]|nr:cobalt ECF transporter T component CbiQ [Cyanothece sp. SIO2G6]